MKSVRITGFLMKTIDEGNSWQTAGSCTLRLLDPDARMAKTILKQQFNFLHSLSFNTCYVQRRLGRGLPTLDVVGFFKDPTHGIKGRVWVETKVLSAKNFDRDWAAEGQKIEDNFSQVQGEDPTIKGAILLATQLQRDGSSSWQRPKLVAQLFTGVSWVFLLAAKSD